MKTKAEIIDQYLMPEYEHIKETVYFGRLRKKLIRMPEQIFIDFVSGVGFKLQPIIKNHFIITL